MDELYTRQKAATKINVKLPDWTESDKVVVTVCRYLLLLRQNHVHKYFEKIIFPVYTIQYRTLKCFIGSEIRCERKQSEANVVKRKCVGVNDNWKMTIMKSELEVQVDDTWRECLHKTVIAQNKTVPRRPVCKEAKKKMKRQFYSSLNL